MPRMAKFLPNVMKAVMPERQSGRFLNAIPIKWHIRDIGVHLLELLLCTCKDHAKAYQAAFMATLK